MGNKKTEKTKDMGKKKLIITLAAAGGLLAIILGIVLGLIFGASELNYLEDNLGRYVYISEEDYSSFSVDVDFRVADESDVNRLIMNLQYKNKAKEASYDGGNVTSVPITVGDKAFIYYRGYTVDENGVETDITGASNFTSAEEHELDIGSLSFVKGFEEGLIGVVPKEHERFEKILSGEVCAGDVVYLTYKALLPDGSVKNVTSERIELGAEHTDAKYGAGFSAFLSGAEENSKKKIGESISGEHTFEISGQGTALYYDVKVDFATRCESNPVVVKTVFPLNYDEKSLRGKTVFFDVYVRYINVYEVAEFCDSFILDVLKIKEDSLSSYSGSSVSEKFKAKLLEDARTEAEEEKKSLMEEAMWEHYLKKAEFKRLPKSELKKIEEEYYYEIEQGYAMYNSSFESLEEYAIAYFRLGAGVDYQEYITEKAESVIKEKLLFYYVAREAGLVPTEEKLIELRDEMIAEYLDYYVKNIYNEELEKLKTEEEREARIKGIESEMLAYYGEDYFTENAYYAFALDGMLGFAKIK